MYQLYVEFCTWLLNISSLAFDIFKIFFLLKTNANQDITELENKVAALKCQFEKTLNDSTANQKFLEENLVTTKHDLLKLQDQLSTAEKVSILL